MVFNLISLSVIGIFVNSPEPILKPSTPKSFRTSIALAQRSTNIGFQFFYNNQLKLSDLLLINYIFLIFGQGFLPEFNFIWKHFVLW